MTSQFDLYLSLGGAVLALIAGIALRMWVSRRAFYRRNEAGVEEFKSYSAKLGTNAIEGVVSIISVLLLLFGVFYGFNILGKIKV